MTEVVVVKTKADHVEDLDLSAKIETPSGWIELENETEGYWLHSDSFSGNAVSHRKTELSSEWMEGTYVARTVRENVSEKVSVYVAGMTPYQLAERLSALTDGFDQLNYQMVVRFFDHEEEWTCQVADYVISTKGEMRRATMALVEATVPRLPSVSRSKVFP